MLDQHVSTLDLRLARLFSHPLIRRAMQICTKIYGIHNGSRVRSREEGLAWHIQDPPSIVRQTTACDYQYPTI